MVALNLCFSWELSKYFDGVRRKDGEATTVNVIVGSEVRIYCGVGC